MATGRAVLLMLQCIVLNENTVHQVLTRSLYIKSTLVAHGVFNLNISDNTALVFRSNLLTRLPYTVASILYVLSRLTHLQAQLQHEFLQQSRLAVLEDANLTQSIQMHVNSYFSLQLVRQGSQYAFLVQRL